MDDRDELLERGKSLLAARYNEDVGIYIYIYILRSVKRFANMIALDDFAEVVKLTNHTQLNSPYNVRMVLTGVSSKGTASESTVFRPNLLSLAQFLDLSSYITATISTITIHTKNILGCYSSIRIDKV